VITAALFVWLALQSVSPEGAKHMQAGVEAQKQGQFDVAVKEFRKATESDPNLAEAFLDLGQVLQQTHDYPAAIVALKRALELNPELDAAHLQLGFALLALGYAEESIPHLERVHALIALGIAQILALRWPNIQAILICFTTSGAPAGCSPSEASTLSSPCIPIPHVHTRQWERTILCSGRCHKPKRNIWQPWSKAPNYLSCIWNLVWSTPEPQT